MNDENSSQKDFHEELGHWGTLQRSLQVGSGENNVLGSLEGPLRVDLA